jgi:hypothetical protein
LLVSRYKEPDLRFDAIRVVLDRLGSSDRAAVLALEIGDVAQVKLSPGNPPIGPSIERYGLIISIKHEIGPEAHEVTFGLGSLQTSLFVIGDAEFGTIGEGAAGVLGF